MTITANVGLPGSGKSLHSVGEEICGALRERRLVITNVPLKIKAISEYIGFDVSNLVIVLTEDTNNREPFSDIADFEIYDKWRSEGSKGYGPLFVIDECHKCFADVTGLKANDHPIAKWFAEHRHKGCDVLLMTQDRMAIPSAIRRRVEETYLYRKLLALGLSGRYVRLMFHGEGKEALNRQFGKYKKEWFGLYYSTRAGVSERIHAGTNIFMNPRFLFIAAALAGIAFFLFSHGVHMPGATSVPKPGATSDALSSAARGDGSKVLERPQELLGKPAEIHTAEIDALRAEVAKFKLQAQLDMYKKARLPAGGQLTPGDGGDGAEVRWTDAAPLPRHRLDGAQIQIASYMMMAGQVSYWLRVRNDGREEQISDEGLRSDGFEVVGQGRCVAILKGDHGVYRLTCDGWSIIGDKKVADVSSQTLPSAQLDRVKLPNGEWGFSESGNGSQP